MSPANVMAVVACYCCVLLPVMSLLTCAAYHASKSTTREYAAEQPRE